MAAKAVVEASVSDVTMCYCAVLFPGRIGIIAAHPQCLTKRGMSHAVTNVDIVRSIKLRHKGNLSHPRHRVVS